ncbi:MAG: 4-hydroxy-3-methylbut-2-enyl diphosphate reductase [Clostridiales bacterium]|nr:4-hydroxy-3-methylbut-2-enyl diphosphate reductase [Clostridiales bacterium]
MKIITAKNIGFCPGVRHAVKTALDAAAEVKQKGGRIFSFGYIIHNAQVVGRLEREGIRVTETLEELQPGDTVVIRAHGVSPEIYDGLKAVGAEIIDCTCPYVKKTQSIVKEKYADGYEIIIAGERGHPEIIGINGCCQNNAKIASDTGEIAAFIMSGQAACADGENHAASDKKCCLVFQTTYNYAKYSDIIKKLRKDDIKTLEIFNTICYTTMERQKEVSEIAQKSDAVLVVGDQRSSNTGKLFSIASEYCGKVFFITELSDLKKVDNNIKHLGIVTGASTSDELIMEVVFTMSKAQQGDGLEVVNVAADTAIESAVLNKEDISVKADDAKIPQTTEEQAVAADPSKADIGDGIDADAEKKALAAERKAAAAEKKAVAAEKKAADAVQRAAEAEKKVAEAEKKVAEAEEKIDLDAFKAEIKAKAVEKKVEEKPAEPVVKKPVPVKKVVSAEPEEKITMEDVMASKNSGFTYKNGKKVTAIVISAGADGVNVAIGGKKDGFIDKSEMNTDGSYDPTLYKSGDIIDAVIIENPNKATYINLSKKQIDQLRENDRLCEEILKGAEFELVCDKVVKGGLTGRYGSYTVFVPASQIRIGFVKNLEEYLGKKLRLRALPPKEKEVVNAAAADDAEQLIDGEEAVVATEAAPAQEGKHRSGKFIVASQKIVLEKERQEKEDEFWDSMSIGDVVSGKVKRFVSFGAFVSVKGFDCLVHISDISWNRISDPSKAFDINGVYDFIILKADRDTNKVSLGYRQLQKKPYELAYEKYPVGAIVTGKVERIKDFGAFVSLDDGVDGLVHVSQISHNWIKNANEALKVGDEITAKVISFEENKITLSIKDLLEKPEITEEPVDESGEYSYESREKKFKKREAGKRETKADGQPAPERSADAAPAQYANKPKRDRRPKFDDGFGQSEWVSNSATTSLGDLFKDIKLDVEE